MSKKQPAGPDITSTSDGAKAAKKAETLMRLANNRVARLIHDYQLVSNLAQYKPTPEQVAAIETALANAHKVTIARLKGTSTSASGFALPGVK